MGKKNDEFEDMSIDLDDGSIGEEMDDLSEGQVQETSRRRTPASAAPERDDDDYEDQGEHDEPPVSRSGKKRGSAARQQPASRKKNIIAGTLIGIMVVVGSAGFMYMTMKPKTPQYAMSPFDSAPVPQTALTQPAVADQAPSGMGQPAAPVDPGAPPVASPQAPVDMQSSQAMAETSSAAIAGGEVSLERERLQQATHEAVAAATQDLSNQVLAMGIQIADLQSKLAESSNRSVCDTDAIVEELRRKMKDDEQSAKSAKAVAKKETPKEVSKPAPVVKAPKKKAIDDWKVLGLSADRAVVVTAKGDQVVVTAGDVIDGVTIKGIDPVKGVVVTNEGTVK